MNQSEEQAPVPHTYSHQSTFILFLLIVISLFSNISGFDYNVCIAAGMYYLATINPIIFTKPYFYVLVGLTILADVVSIILLVGKVSVFNAIIFPVLEILLKVAFIALEVLHWKYVRGEDQDPDLKAEAEQGIQQGGKANKQKSDHAHMQNKKSNRKGQFQYIHNQTPPQMEFANTEWEQTYT